LLIFQNETHFVLDAYNWAESAINTLVDVGGGLGYLVSEIVKRAPPITAYVYDLASTLNDPKIFAAAKSGVSDRVKYVPGDMFTGKDLPASDAYIMKHILHDWNDEEVRGHIFII
jgi:ubiquinone/menaquinone biosynthesis C-methylase UbiE